MKYYEARDSYRKAKALGNRNLKDEKIISMYPRWAYNYARDVLKGRFELGEESISKNSELSYYYARDILKGRFTDGENVIKKCTDHSYMYNKFMKEKLSPSEYIAFKLEF